ncbi:acyl carrier protein [bacterium]|jgi:acyl carrier protein|nr:acyl carrier protein [bacterium]
MSQDEIFQKVATTLVDALGVDEDEVTKDATLTGDLGAESIDFLDIVFRLEKNFDIKIPRGDLFPDEKLFSDARFVKNGKMTAEGLAELRQRLPFADIDAFAKNPSVKELSSLYTVETIVKYIEGKIR